MKWSVAFSFYHINLKQKNNVQKIIQVKNIDIRFHCFILLTDIYCLIRWMSRIFNNSCFYRSNERNWCKYLHVSRQKTNRKCPSVLQLLLLLLLHWKKWKKMVLLLSSYWPHTAIVTVFFSFTCFLLSKHTNTTKVGKINNYMEKRSQRKISLAHLTKINKEQSKFKKEIKKRFFSSVRSVFIRILINYMVT